MNPAGLLGSRPVFVHAHPDDETILTGALLALLGDAGVDAGVVTCTRGEQGESAVPGLAGAALIERRRLELAGALEMLGVRRHAYLGTPPARAVGLEPRRYTDSGMEWIEPGLAGPAASVGADAFTRAPSAETAGDLVALGEVWAPTALISYADDGGYGHPDHVEAHHVTVAAAAALGLPCWEVIAEPGPADGIVVDAIDALPSLRSALACYATQLRVGVDGITHVGGQFEPFHTRVGLRRR